MNRRSLLSALALGVVACTVARPALAQGLITFHNTSFAEPVLVEVRIGDTMPNSTLYGTQKIAKNATWLVDTGGVLAWWRREVTPGANDGKFTDWQRVNTISSDENVKV